MTDYSKLWTRKWAQALAARKTVETGVHHIAVCLGPKLWITRPSKAA